jgi:5-methylcytosine-specific restriction endonuclease McrA
VTEPRTVGELLHTSYANLGMAHAAVSKGDRAYGRVHYMIRAKLYSGLRKGTMNLGSLVDDERLKMILPQACAYCGGRERLSVDHLIATKAGGPDTGDNIVWSCRSCNSSKGSTDVLEWLAKRGQFPPLLLLRRHLKLAVEISVERTAMDLPIVEGEGLPFSLSAIPISFPAPTELMLWISDRDAASG